MNVPEPQCPICGATGASLSTFSKSEGPTLHQQVEKPAVGYRCHECETCFTIPPAQLKSDQPKRQDGQDM